MIKMGNETKADNETKTDLEKRLGVNGSVRDAALEEIRELYKAVFQYVRNYCHKPSKDTTQRELGLLIVEEEALRDTHKWLDLDAPGTMKYFVPGTFRTSNFAFYPGAIKSRLHGLLKTVVQPTMYTLTKTDLPKIETFENISLDKRGEPVYKTAINLNSLDSKQDARFVNIGRFEEEIGRVVEQYKPKKVA